jgi:pyruvate formate lyase activating enzyme
MDKQRTPAATLTRAREIALKNGLHYVYTGNVHDAAGSSTYCASCGTRLIERDWYELGEWRLDARGRCLQCGSQLAGVFDGAPGTWGARRLPVRIAV